VLLFITNIEYYRVVGTTIIYTHSNTLTLCEYLLCRRLNTSITTTKSMVVVAVAVAEATPVKGSCFLFTQEITNGNFQGGIYYTRHYSLQNKRTSLESQNILKRTLRKTLVRYRMYNIIIYRIVFLYSETGNILGNTFFLITYLLSKIYTYI